MVKKVTVSSSGRRSRANYKKKGNLRGNCIVCGQKINALHTYCGQHFVETLKRHSAWKRLKKKAKEGDKQASQRLLELRAAGVFRKCRPEDIVKRAEKYVLFNDKEGLRVHWFKGGVGMGMFWPDEDIDDETEQLWGEKGF